MAQIQSQYNTHTDKKEMSCRNQRSGSAKGSYAHIVLTEYEKKMWYEVADEHYEHCNTNYT